MQKNPLEETGALIKNSDVSEILTQAKRRVLGPVTIAVFSMCVPALLEVVTQFDFFSSRWASFLVVGLALIALFTSGQQFSSLTRKISRKVEEEEFRLRTAQLLYLEKANEYREGLAEKFVVDQLASQQQYLQQEIQKLHALRFADQREYQKRSRFFEEQAEAALREKVREDDVTQHGGLTGRYIAFGGELLHVPNVGLTGRRLQVPTYGDEGLAEIPDLAIEVGPTPSPSSPSKENSDEKSSELFPLTPKQALAAEQAVFGMMRAESKNRKIEEKLRELLAIKREPPSSPDDLKERLYLRAKEAAEIVRTFESVDEFEKILELARTLESDEEVEEVLRLARTFESVDEFEKILELARTLESDDELEEEITGTSESDDGLIKTRVEGRKKLKVPTKTQLMNKAYRLLVLKLRRQKEQAQEVAELDIEQEVLFTMPPKRRREVEVEIFSRKKAEPNIVFDAADFESLNQSLC